MRFFFLLNYLMLAFFAKAQNVVVGKKSNRISSLDRLVIRGAATNGLSGGIYLRKEDQAVYIYIYNGGFTNTSWVNPESVKTNQAVPKPPHGLGYFDTNSYFTQVWMKPTNKFCGPVELVDTNGNQVSLVNMRPTSRPQPAGCGKFPLPFVDEQ